MKFAGIIAEYDPFHNGHAWQLAQARALGAQRVAVAMSCGLTQRGALPLLPGHRPTAKSCPGAVQRSIPHRAETAACRRGTQLCRRPAGGGAGAVPGVRRCRTAGQAQQ